MPGQPTVDDQPLYHQRELEHMQDVQNVYLLPAGSGASFRIIHLDWAFSPIARKPFKNLLKVSKLAACSLPAWLRWSVYWQ
jgi:hypothetical protein